MDFPTLSSFVSAKKILYFWKVVVSFNHGFVGQAFRKFLKNIFIYFHKIVSNQEEVVLVDHFHLLSLPQMHRRSWFVQFFWTLNLLTFVLFLFVLYFGGNTSAIFYFLPLNSFLVNWLIVLSFGVVSFSKRWFTVFLGLYLFVPLCFVFNVVSMVCFVPVLVTLLSRHAICDIFQALVFFQTVDGRKQNIIMVGFRVMMMGM